jgi:hypothetical protein
MGGVAWNGGSLEQACDGGALGRKKVTNGSADGKSPMGKVRTWTNYWLARSTLKWQRGWRCTDGGSRS